MESRTAGAERELKLHLAVLEASATTQCLPQVDPGPTTDHPNHIHVEQEFTHRPELNSAGSGRGPVFLGAQGYHVVLVLLAWFGQLRWRGKPPALGSQNKEEFDLLLEDAEHTVSTRVFDAPFSPKIEHQKWGVRLT